MSRTQKCKNFPVLYIGIIAKSKKRSLWKQKTNRSENESKDLFCISAFPFKHCSPLLCVYMCVSPAAGEGGAPPASPPFSTSCDLFLSDPCCSFKEIRSRLHPTCTGGLLRWLTQATYLHFIKCINIYEADYNHCSMLFLSSQNTMFL